MAAEVKVEKMSRRVVGEVGSAVPGKCQYSALRTAVSPGIINFKNLL